MKTVACATRHRTISRLLHVVACAVERLENIHSNGSVCLCTICRVRMLYNKVIVSLQKGIKLSTLTNTLQDPPHHRCVFKNFPACIYLKLTSSRNSYSELQRYSSMPFCIIHLLEGRNLLSKQAF